MSSGFSTRSHPNQTAQLQRLALNLNFACRKFRHDTFLLANNKGTDQTTRMRRLDSAFVVRKLQTGFLALRHTL